MARLMRCLYCGLLQDEPQGVKTCARCGGELAFEQALPGPSYVRVQMELDQIRAPSDQIVDRHLAITIQTPPEVPPEEAAPTASGRQPITFTAVLDVSGSMRGQKIESAKEAVRQAVLRLHEGDVFALVTFSSQVRTVLEPTVVTRRLRDQVGEALQQVVASGSTALCGGLEAGTAATVAHTRDTNLILLLSDGQANEGETDLEQIGRRAWQAQERKIITSTLGVGTDYNEALMVEIATQGGGRFYHVLHAHQIVPYVAGELGEASALAAREATLRLTLPPGTGLYPLSAAYRVTEAGVSLGDVPVDTELEVILRLLLPAQSAGARVPIEGRLAYRSPAGHDLEAPLNVVTVRYVPAAEFGRRDGAVAPVIGRVLDQMKATGVLVSSRAAATRGQAAAAEQAQLSVAELRRYASLLGDEEAERLADEQQTLYHAMAAAPADSKSFVSSAFRRQRSTKDFDK
ncbi:MAG: VWA domain-containing protein [Anaerolineales bacterium]|nr:VWA domain-containing protein [Anaerolineales bacterium]